MSEVDNIISSYNAEATVEEVKTNDTPAPVAEEAVTQAEPEATEQEAEGDVKEDGFEEWDAKRAKNRISRQDKRIAKLTWEKHQYEQKLAELQAQNSKVQPQQATTQSQTKPDGEPREEDYVGRFDEFVVAKAIFQAEQKAKQFIEQQNQQQSQTIQQQKQAEYLNSLVAKADSAAEKFVAEVPDAISAQKDFEDLDLSPQVAMAVLTLEDKAPHAVYQLWKAGKLDELEGATPMQAQILLASALATPFSKPVSKAPAPVKSAKGSVSSGFNPDSYRPDELLKAIRKG